MNASRLRLRRLLVVTEGFLAQNNHVPPSDSPASDLDIEQLWTRFHDELFGFVRARLDSDEVSEDVLQTAFLRAHRALQRGRPPARPRAWLYQIARNLIKDTYRSRGRQKALARSLPSEPSAHSSELDDEGEISQIVAGALPGFIAALSAPLREALTLSELEGLSHAEAAERAGVSLSCMKARVRRGREQVRAALLRCCFFETDARGKLVDCAPRQSSSACACSAPADIRHSADGAA